MSFKDTFTRNSSGNQNLQYDDVAFHHFFITILLVIAAPLFYTILKTVLNPFGHLPKLKDVQNKQQFKQKLSRFKKQNKYSYINCSFIIKIIILFAIIYGLFYSFISIQQSSQQLKGFDPYQILGVQIDAPVQKIKKAYRKLALIYHPDRNQNNPQASAKFIMISKAYQCLTDQQAKEKCQKYGNPEGSNSFNVGIALPSFLIRKQNHVFIMAIVFFIVVIVLPLFLIQYHSQMNKYDDYGMLTQNYGILNELLNQHFSFKDCIKTFSICMQFKELKTTRSQIPKLEEMLKTTDEEVSKTLRKKNYLAYIKKCMLLFSARVNEEPIPAELQEDNRVILRKLPIILRASVMFGFQRSLSYMMRHQKFVGFNALKSLIWFGQYFIQGKSFQKSESYEQINLNKDEIQKIYKKKKNKKITNLQCLISNQSQRQFFMSLIDDNRKSYIKQCLDYFPRNKLNAYLKSGQQTELYAQDSIKLIIEVQSNRKSSFCSSNNYPFLKVQGWYIIVVSNNYIVYLQHFNFDTQKKEFKVDVSHGKQGKYDLNVHIMSDSYFGLDNQSVVKYEVKPARKFIQTEPETEAQQEPSLLRKMLENIIPKEEQQVSDKEDNDQDQKQKALKDNSKQNKQK